MKLAWLSGASFNIQIYSNQYLSRQEKIGTFDTAKQRRGLFCCSLLGFFFWRSSEKLQREILVCHTLLPKIMKILIFRADRKCVWSVYHKYDYFTSFGGGFYQKKWTTWSCWLCCQLLFHLQSELKLHWGKLSIKVL